MIPEGQRGSIIPQLATKCFEIHEIIDIVEMS